MGATVYANQGDVIAFDLSNTFNLDGKRSRLSIWWSKNKDDVFILKSCTLTPDSLINFNSPNMNEYFSIVDGGIKALRDGVVFITSFASGQVKKKIFQ